VIVTCQKCSTQFHLDDSKVPATGIRVRCSRCKFAFEVESPERPDVDHGASIARETLATGAVGTDDSESDWQFSEDIAETGARALPTTGAFGSAPIDAAAAAVDDLLGSVVSTAGARFEDDGPEPVDPFDGFEGRDAFGVSDDIGASDPSLDELERIELDGDEVPRASDEVHEDLSIGSDEIDIARAGTASGADSAHRSDHVEAAPFDSGVVESPTPAIPVVPVASAVAESPETEIPPVPWQASAADFEAFDADSATRGASHAISRARACVGWALSISLCAAALSLGLFPRTPAASSEFVPLSIAGFEAQAVRGSWIENVEAGPIYVISGSLRAAGSTPVAGTELRIRLLDSRGEPIAAQTSAVGPPIPSVALRESSPRDLRDRQERAATHFMSRKLTQGDRRPFHAVFAGVTPDAAAFEFMTAEGASSQERDTPFESDGAAAP
jgi:predicted Zn finger-like uncharacterized protein